MSRKKEFDIAKGLCMILVILGHCEGMPSTLLHLISSFHMPLFFIVGGAFYKIPVNTTEYIKRKLNRLIVPYVLSMVVISIPSILKKVIVEKDFGIILMWILRIVNANSHSDHNLFGILGISVFWFLVAYFNASVILTIILKKTRKPFLWIILISISGILMQRYIDFEVPFSLYASLVATVYLLIGYLASQYEKILNKYRFVILFIALVIWAVDLYFYSDISCIDLAIGKIDTILCFLGSIAATYVVVSMSKLTSIMNNRTEILDYIGRNSLVILCAHGFECFYNPLSYIPQLHFDNMSTIEKTIGRIVFPIIVCMIISQFSFIRKVYGIKKC